MDGGDPSISGSPHEDDMEVGLPSAPRFDIDLEEECQSTELAHLEVVAESNRPVKDKTKGSDGVPEIDMEFESEERAYNFYNKYGGKVGFSIRRSWANKCKDGVVRRRLFCCSRQGHRSHDKRDVKNHRPETRTGCLAHMVIALQPNGRYRVCQFEPNHNHDVGKPSKSRMLRSQKASAAAQAAETDISDSTGWGLGRLICIQMSIRAAIELDVFNIIAEAGPGAQLSSSEMVTKMPTTNPNAATALDRILRMLGANCILSMSMRPCNEGEKKHERVYGLTSKSRSLVTTNGEGASVAPIVLASSEKAVIESLYLLKDAVLEQGCIPFNKAHGLSFLEYAAKEPGMKAVFDQALGTRSAIFFHEVLKVYKGFNDIRELVDVGGGTGSLLGMIVSRFPHIRGINFELPHVIADAPKFPGCSLSLSLSLSPTTLSL
uniref:Uncharacterized protein n=1 Tax=Nelumbo nucifera TaxID=4432 RepID=A0A822ZZL3_NELNU|nr:TPA_asm: hypothetical protein HUJ06_018908 [Nelumbo nucifera]